MDDPKPAAGKIVRSRELAFLPSRRKANPGNDIQIRARVNALRASLASKRERDGEDAHDAGTALVVLYSSFAERLYGHASFLEFARRELDLAKATAYRYLRVARYATREQARWGVETCLAAARLVELLASDDALRRRAGLARPPTCIADLAGGNFVLSDGRHVRFKSAELSAVDVEDLVDQLGERAGRADRRLSLADRRRNQALAQALATQSGLDGVSVRYVARRGGTVLRLELPRDLPFEKAAARLARVLGES